MYRLLNIKNLTQVHYKLLTRQNDLKIKSLNQKNRGCHCLCYVKNRVSGAFLMPSGEFFFLTLKFVYESL